MRLPYLPPERDKEVRKTESEEIICPSCGNAYKQSGIGIHWAKSSHCIAPYPDVQKQQILIGIVLSGGSAKTDTGNPLVSKTSQCKRPLEWIDEQLEFWAGDVVDAQIRDDSDAVYLYTRKMEFAKHLREIDIQNVNPDPTILSVIFSFKGRVNDTSFYMRGGLAPDYRVLLDNLGIKYSYNDRRNRPGLSINHQSKSEFMEMVDRPPFNKMGEKYRRFQHARSELADIYPQISD